MVQFQILSGEKAGTGWVTRRFPVRIGREPGSDLRLEADGVWEQHCELKLDGAQCFVISARSDALMAVNHQRAHSARLRNGDTVELGSARLQFWIADPPRRGVRLREAFVWALMIAIALAQLALVRLALP
jgi:pSer/pThr/pTyr-binding forkhead associated (FHA) protein